MKAHHSPLLVTVNGNYRVSAGRLLQVGNFSIARGEHWCVFGGNGSGKTVLANWLRGRLPAGHKSLAFHDGFTSAQIATVSFEEQQRLCELDNRHDISEFSESATDQGTTVLALIVGTAESSEGEFDQAADEYAANLIAKLGLVPLLNQGIRYLSSGQMRKALIARALVSRPALLILDDPLESIDQTSRLVIERVLEEWRSEKNASLVLSRRKSHIPAGTTHLALMRKLCLVGCGKFSDLIHTPAFREIAEAMPSLPEYLPCDVKNRMPDLRVASAAAPLIELRNVSAAYAGRVILQNVDWTMKRGEHVLIEGPNGCGKSTLLSLINGDNHKAYGQNVILFGRPRGSGETVWDIKSHFGTVSNELHNRYIRGWRVPDVIVSGFFDSVGLYDAPGGSHINAANQWLQALDLQESADAWYHEISFGQQRLVLLARAMVKRPDVLILDEPCVGLDDVHTRMVLGTLDVIAQQTSTQLIYVTHARSEYPSCINTFMRFIPCRPGEDRNPGETTSGAPWDDPDVESIRSRTPHTIEIRKVPQSPSKEDYDRR
jgi:molybdate transport system ATP-binding protein